MEEVDLRHQASENHLSKQQVNHHQEVANHQLYLEIVNYQSFAYVLPELRDYLNLI